MPASPDLLAIYQRLGLHLLYWERVGPDPKAWKGPHGAAAKGWNAPDKRYPLEQYDPATMNLGVFTGAEITPGKFLLDVDLDWTEGISLARTILPSTGFGFGRPGKKISHLFYTVSESFGVEKYCDIADTGDGDGITFVELRGGQRSHQTMVAPSLHSPNTRIELVLAGDIVHLPIDTLKTGIIDYAIACLLLKRFPGSLHHDQRVMIAGWLLRERSMTAERVQTILEEVCRAQVLAHLPDMTFKDIADCRFAVNSTVTKLSEHKKVSGAPSVAKHLGECGKAVITRVRKWIGHDTDFIRAEGKIVANSQVNIRHALTLCNATLSYNEFAHKLLLNDKPLEDANYEALYLQIDNEFHFRPTLDFFKIVVRNAAFANSFHPVKQYLDELVWDGVPRLDTWIIDAAHADDSPYVRAVSAIMLIAAVRRIRQPGCKYDEMVVWESVQGADKSSAAQALCPDPTWFSDDLPLNLRSQQLIEATLGKWIVEASDLAGKRKAEIEQLKAMLSRQVDGPARMAYAHFPVERPRHFILIGTTNSSVYLTDPTGARRFWPIAVQRFRVQWIREQRNQLWAEACVREQQGVPIRLDEALWPDAQRQQQTRSEVDPWEAVIYHALMSLVPDSRQVRRIATSAIWQHLQVDPSRRDRTGALRIADIMQRFHFRRTTVRTSLGPETGYLSTRWPLPVPVDTTIEDVSQSAILDDGQTDNQLKM